MSKTAKIQQLRDAGWTVGTADEFVDSLSVTIEQRDLLNSLLETRKEFFDNPTQETYEKGIKAYREITRPIAEVRGGIFDELLNNKWCRRQLQESAHKLVHLMYEHKINELRSKK
jgi:hypothetical protein